jgi:ribosomal protein S18 acetylase RimI-like enzyme
LTPVAVFSLLVQSFPGTPPMIRPTEPHDFPTLIAMAEETGVFKPLEIVALGEVLRDYEAHNKALGHRCITSKREQQLVGFAYYAPAAMTDRTWYLYWIAVTKRIQAKGLGGEMLKYVEEDIHRAHGRILLIETSSLSHYDLTRKFYLKQGYEHACRLKDFYADGDHLEVFKRRIAP